MIKSIIISASISIFVTVFTTLEGYAQDPNQANTVKAAQTTKSDKTPDRGTTEIPLANLFPTRDPADMRTTTTVVVPPPTASSRHESLGLQHEIHGESITSFSITNGVPRSASGAVGEKR